MFELAKRFLLQYYFGITPPLPTEAKVKKDK
jgi:hypothetical protein